MSSSHLTGPFRGLRGSLVLALLLLATVAMAVPSGANAYDCYWATTACGTGGVGAGDTRQSGIQTTYATYKPFMNNANTGTSKQINVRQWNDAGTVILWNKNYYGSTRVWVVTAPELSPAAISRQYICKNNHSAPVNVNCGKHYYWE